MNLSCDAAQAVELLSANCRVVRLYNANANGRANGQCTACMFLHLPSVATKKKKT